VRACLEQILISRIFDFDGLLEVLDELDDLVRDPSQATDPLDPPGNQEQIQDSSPTTTTKHLEVDSMPLNRRTEVQDSEDEGSFSSCTEAGVPELPSTPTPPKQQSPVSVPDIVLITRISTVLSPLFTHRGTDQANMLLKRLSERLLRLSRGPGGPLIILLNSTRNRNPPRPPPNPDTSQGNADHHLPHQLPTDARPAIAPTLRSVFNPPPVDIPSLPYAYDTPLSRRNSPTFGLAFTQMLDLHLLCTRIPAAPPATAVPEEGSFGDDGGRVRYVWAVEVLLDDVGVWDPAEARPGGKPRTNRERRGGLVDVRGGGVYAWRGVED